MFHIVRTDSNHPDFIALVKCLDAELAERNGEQHAFYDQFNKISMIQHAIVLYLDDKPVGCGAIKELATDTMEVKRMYTVPAVRGMGVATKVLQALEEWAAALGYNKCVLETGRNLPQAIILYQKNDYKTIPNYGQYIGIANSVCFEKVLMK